MWRHGPVHPGLGVRGSGFGGRGFGIRGQGFGARGSDSKAAAGSVGVAEATVRPRGEQLPHVSGGPANLGFAIFDFGLAGQPGNFRFAILDFGLARGPPAARNPP
jgi:hypothetical protein